MNETAKQYRVLVVDDHPIVRRGFAQLLNQEPDITGGAEAEDMAEAVTALEAGHPDRVIGDIVDPKWE